MSELHSAASESRRGCLAIITLKNNDNDLLAKYAVVDTSSISLQRELGDLALPRYRVPSLSVAEFRLRPPQSDLLT